MSHSLPFRLLATPWRARVLRYWLERRGACLVGAALALGPLPAFAQDPAREDHPPAALEGRPGASDREEPQARAQEGHGEADARINAMAAFQQGVAAYEQADFNRAVVHFLRADGFLPSAAFSFNIARAYDKLGNVASSLAWYRDYLRRAPAAADREQVAMLIEERQLALSELGLQQLTVLSEPPGATLTVDGKAVGVTPWTGEIVPGKHRVELSHDGLQSEARDIYLPATRALDLSLVLGKRSAPNLPPRASAAQAARVAPNSAKDQERSDSARIWPWVALGAGGVALGAAAAVEFARRSSESDARRAPTQVGRAEEYDEMKDRQSLARTLGIVGGSLVLVGGVLWVLDLDSEPPADAVRAVWSPRFDAACTREGCGVRVWGTL